METSFEEDMEYMSTHTEDEFMVYKFGKIVTKHCDTHGEYEAHEQWKRCDKCQEEEEKLRKDMLSPTKGRGEYETGLPTKYETITLDDWIADDEEQRKVKIKVSAFAKGDIKRMLLIGTCGTGKTMLAAGIVNDMISNRTYPIYTTVPRLIRDIRDNWNKRDDWGNKISEQDSMDKYIKTDVLIVDELGSGRCSEDDKLIFSEILCDRYSEDLPTLLISNLDSDAIKKTVLDERAADRMREEGHFVAMNWKSKRGEL